jgi:LmbE family N-acetylglucosaminyl deacetylase
MELIQTPDRVLCLIAHPDDLEPQAGGTIARLTRAGSRVHVLHAITPELDSLGNQVSGHKDERERESMTACQVLGATVDFLQCDPDTFSLTQPLVQIFDSEVREFNPDLIITHHEVDTQQDHVVMAKIAQTVGRRNRIATWHLSHSFPGGYLPHRPQPNLFVDITSVQLQKLEAVGSYKSQRQRYEGNGLLKDNWIDIIEARDRYYGGMLNQDGMTSTVYAEGFVVGKMVWPE